MDARLQAKKGLKLMRFTIRLVVVLGLFLGSAIPASAQGKVSGSVEVQNVLSESGVVPQLDAYVHGPLSGKIGWTVWMLVSKSWSEGLFGVTYAPAKWIEVSASAGLESNKSPFRGAASIWMGSGKYSFVSLHEKGGSGRWMKNVATYEVNKTLTVGVLQQSFVGVGPYAAVKVGRMTIWGAYAVADDRGLLTAKFTF